MRQLVVSGWNFIFNSDVSPLRHIPDTKRRHLVLQTLGLMWAVSFGIALGSYTVMAMSVRNRHEPIRPDNWIAR